jgi:DNA-binding NarL/FixJ family response regulator
LVSASARPLIKEASLTNKIRILLIEDNRFLREGITDTLRSHGDFVVDALADVVDPEVQTEGTRPPDVVLLDLSVENDHSLRLMSALRERFPESKVIAMDILPEQTDVVEFVKAGGSGFILKSAPAKDYVRTIQAVAGGSAILPADLTKSLFAQLVESAIANPNPAHAIQLTRREHEIVDLISRGMSNKEIAQQLHIATFTVKSHVHNVLKKLELSNRQQIAAFVRDEREP